MEHCHTNFSSGKTVFIPLRRPERAHSINIPITETARYNAIAEDNSIRIIFDHPALSRIFTVPVSGAVCDAGFAGDIVTFEQVKGGRIPVAGATAPVLAFWIDIYGARAGHGLQVKLY